MKQAIVGAYYLGYESVQIVMREGTGGEFYLTPEKGSCARIKIGAEYDTFQDVVTVLIHETMEFAMTRLRCRMEIREDMGNDHGQYLFLIDHSHFSNACAMAAETIASCWSDLQRTWLNWKLLPDEG